MVERPTRVKKAAELKLHSMIPGKSTCHNFQNVLAGRNKPQSFQRLRGNMNTRLTYKSLDRKQKGAIKIMFRAVFGLTAEITGMSGFVMKPRRSTPGIEPRLANPARVMRAECTHDLEGRLDFE